MSTLELLWIEREHRVRAEYRYTVPQVYRGYAGQTLYVNVRPERSRRGPSPSR